MCNPSKWEAELYRLVAGVPGFGVCMAEVKVLPDTPYRYGPVDVWLASYGVGVMMDGEHHHPSLSSGHHTKSSSAQANTDMIFNLAVLADGNTRLRGVVRLHYIDRRFWLHALWHAVMYARSPGVRKFVAFTPSYCLLDVVL